MIKRSGKKSKAPEPPTTFYCDLKEPIEVSMTPGVILTPVNDHHITEMKTSSCKLMEEAFGSKASMAKQKATKSRIKDIKSSIDFASTFLHGSSPSSANG